MSSRFASRSSLNQPRTKFAIVTGMQMLEFQISNRCVRHYWINSDSCLIDRRRLARAIRRYSSSVRADIEQLEGETTMADEDRQLVQSLLKDLARTFESEHRCECASIIGPITATGHKQDCPVDDAVREDLARAGIV